MQLQVIDLEAMMYEALAARGLSAEDSAFIARDYLEAELENHRTHGIGKFLLIDHALATRGGPIALTGGDSPLTTVDGNRELGQIAARKCTETAIANAKSFGIGLVTLRNTSRYSRLSIYAKLIADQGYVGIVMNNAGPPAVAPYGSRDPILGTNPIAFGFPGDQPILIDLATSEQPWGEIRQATLENRPLPENTFLDREGNYTTDPEQADAVSAFGGAKGSALCLAIELLALTVTGAKAGLDVADEFDNGAIFMALRPQGESDAVSRNILNLLNSVRSSRPQNPNHPVRVPGDKSSATLQETVRAGNLDVDVQTITILRRMAKGGPGLESNNKLN